MVLFCCIPSREVIRVKFVGSPCWDFFPAAYFKGSNRRLVFGAKFSFLLKTTIIRKSVLDLIDQCQKAIIWVAFGKKIMASFALVISLFHSVLISVVQPVIFVAQRCKKKTD